jgi:hypothetical protein
MIYEQKNYKSKQPDFYKFLLDLKDTVEIERHVSTKNNNLDQFLDFWQNIADL